jgi:hypothetical protein
LKRPLVNWWRRFVKEVRSPESGVRSDPITIFIEPIVPDRTREKLPEEGRGLAFFGNAVQYIRNHLL